MAKFSTHERGFTLIEALVAIAVITLISMVVMGALAPWMQFRQSIDTERKMQDIKQAIVAYYENNAMAVEAQADGTFAGFTSSAVDADGSCEPQSDAFSDLGGVLSESPQQVSLDGYRSSWCVFISPAMSQVRDGSILWYRNIAVVSPGLEGKLNEGTSMDEAGQLILKGDDLGILVSGLEIQQRKLRETMRRLNRIAATYETYFTARYLTFADRDISRYYFSSQWDASGQVPSTQGLWGTATSTLGALGVSNADSVSAWELNNEIQVGNYNEVSGVQQVRSPATTGTGVLPYTALLRARIPAPPGGGELYVEQVVTGNY